MEFRNLHNDWWRCPQTLILAPMENQYYQLFNLLFFPCIETSGCTPKGDFESGHPISKTFDEVISIFGSMGYAVAEGPDIETDFYNFTFCVDSVALVVD